MIPIIHVKQHRVNNATTRFTGFAAVAAVYMPEAPSAAVSLEPDCTARIVERQNPVANVTPHANDRILREKISDVIDEDRQGQRGLSFTSIRLQNICNSSVDEDRVSSVRAPRRTLV